MSYFDWVIIALYFLAVLGVAVRVRGGIGDLHSYFLAGGQLGTAAVVISIIATETSAATFVGGPDTAYRGNVAYLQTAIGTFFSRFFLAYFFIEAFYRARIFTVYEYLATVFGNTVRVLAALLFTVGRVLASGARLYIAAFAVATILSIPVWSAIVGVAFIAIAYGANGGLRAVVVTDVFQGILFLAIGVVSLCWITDAVGGVGEMAAALQGSEKLALFDFNISIFSADFWASPYTFIGAVLGGFTLSLASHGADQDMVQRMLACRDSAAGKRSLIYAALIEVPVAVLFVFLGLGLWVFFTKTGFPPPDSTESVFPYFIRTALPDGFRGLVIVGLLAAAMSSLDSAITALASVSVRDIQPGFRTLLGKPPLATNNSNTVRKAQWTSVAWGLLLVVVALLLSDYHQTILQQVNDGPDTSRNAELLSLALGVMAWIYGPLLAMFVLARFTNRGSTLSIFAGTACGIAVVLAIAHGDFLQLGWTWLVVVGFLIAVLIGGIAKRGDV